MTRTLPNATAGFSLGGFFDGILLHQVLPWHHLLSNVEGSIFQDIRVQILADGLFHGLMYIVALAGLFFLWWARREFAALGADRVLLAGVLVGFGVWHVVDGVLSHWLLGVHRVRMDVDNPLFWDLLWFVVFGLAFIVAGRWLGRSSGGASGTTRKHIAGLAPLILVCLIIAVAPVAARPRQTLRSQSSGSRLE